jgi:hypothetical protein
MPTPIFIITKDRVTCLKQCIEGYKKLGDIEIVIHDNASTYPPMYKYLNELTDQGVKIYKHPQAENHFCDISDSPRETIEDWYKTNDSPYYIVTDPDIDLENPTPELLNYFIDVSETFNADVVGPMLQLDDLPNHFKLKDEIIAVQKRQFWQPEQQLIMHKGIYIQHCAIDTTFGLYKKNFSFKRLNFGYRVRSPYMAKHLDWYLDTENLSEESLFYIDHCSHLVSTLSGEIKRGYVRLFPWVHSNK